MTAVLFALPNYAETYSGYGSEPTKSSHIGEKEYSPYLNIGYPQRVLWGDTHLHTAIPAQKLNLYISDC